MVVSYTMKSMVRNRMEPSLTKTDEKVQISWLVHSERWQLWMTMTPTTKFERSRRKYRLLFSSLAKLTKNWQKMMKSFNTKKSSLRSVIYKNNIIKTKRVFFNSICIRINGSMCMCLQCVKDMIQRWNKMNYYHLRTKRELKL